MVRSQNLEGLKAARLLMVLSSISPLFILWAIRGNRLVPDAYFVSLCAIFVLLPNLFLWVRIQTAKKLRETREIDIGSAEDHRDHLLVYLFSMLLPFYTDDIGTWRDLSAVLVALGFIVFLFWHLNLHYMNVMFAARGYRVFTIHSKPDDNPLSGKTSLVLITRRINLTPGERLLAYRLSDTVYFEEK
jgi:hypothetical protein